MKSKIPRIVVVSVLTATLLPFASGCANEVQRLETELIAIQSEADFAEEYAKRLEGIAASAMEDIERATNKVRDADTARLAATNLRIEANQKMTELQNARLQRAEERGRSGLRGWWYRNVLRR